MDHTKVYGDLIAKREAEAPMGYSEKHHIIPRSLGGSNQKSNIVRLTGREHFIAHLLLARIHGGTQWMSVIRMKGGRGRYMNGRLYDVARREWALWSSQHQRGAAHWAYGKASPMRGKKRPEFSGDKHPLWGREWTEKQRAGRAKTIGRRQSEETKRKIGAAQMGEKNHSFGKQLTTEHIEKVRAAMKARRLTPEHRAKIGAAHRGKIVSNETRAKQSESRKRMFAARRL